MFYAWSVLVFALGACFPDLHEVDFSDPGIKAHVEANLHARPELNLRYVTVDVHSHIVTLSGLVGSRDEKELIDRIARQTKGVDQLVSNLAIQE